MKLKIGDKAPDFILQCDSENQKSLKDFTGKKVVLYFYPKDNTPGCTKQACYFRDHYAEITNQNVEILGVSKDGTKKHQAFKEKHSLPFPLLADTESKMCEDYGVINPKSMFGKTFLGIERSTFLIDEEGKILQIWRKVKVKDHLKQVLDELSKY